jgi:cytoskeletal protein RodZ
MAQNIGELLREKRLELGLSLDDASCAIKVRTKYLKFLEDDINEKETPPTVYMLGYLKLYANFLGLDGKQIIDQISIFAKEEFPSMNDTYHVKSDPSLKIILISLFCLTLLLVLWSRNIF